MNNLSYRQNIIKSKRQQTSWRDFVMECASWEQFNFYKINGKTSRYPDSNRINKLVDAHNFFDSNENTSIDYNPNQSFFENYKALWSTISFPYLWQFGPGNDNSDYADTTFNSKNCYLSVAGCFDVENVLYSLECMGNLTNIISCVGIHSNSTNIFQCSGIADSYNIFYSYNIQNSSDIWFSSNLTGCRHCIQCTNLTNQSYCINNQQYSEQDYQQQKTLILSQKSTFDHLYTQVDRSINTALGCHNVTNGHLVSYINNAHNVCLVGGDREIKRSDLYDVWSSGGNLTDAYGCMGVSPGDNFYSVINSAFGSNLYYCYFMTECSFCLGCIGLKNKSYCILNKQYTKEEWYQKVDEIFSQMDQDGTLGQFFPATMNPFYFNDTAAYLIDPSFTKEEVTTAGYLWRDEPIKVDIPEWMEVVESKDLGKFEGRMVGTQFLAYAEGKGSTSDGENSVPTDAKRHIDPIILKKTIRDEEGNVYRVIKLEYDFLMKYGLPLPRKHWLTRMKENFKIN